VSKRCGHDVSAAWDPIHRSISSRNSFWPGGRPARLGGVLCSRVVVGVPVVRRRVVARSGGPCRHDWCSHVVLPCCRGETEETDCQQDEHHCQAREGQRETWGTPANVHIMQISQRQAETPLLALPSPLSDQVSLSRPWSRLIREDRQADPLAWDVVRIPAKHQFPFSGLTVVDPVLLLALACFLAAFVSPMCILRPLRVPPVDVPEPIMVPSLRTAAEPGGPDLDTCLRLWNEWGQVQPTRSGRASHASKRSSCGVRMRSANRVKVLVVAAPCDVTYGAPPDQGDCPSIDHVPDPQGECLTHLQQLGGPRRNRASGELHAVPMSNCRHR
jgi:hypothetical protein